MKTGKFWVRFSKKVFLAKCPRMPAAKYRQTNHSDEKLRRPKVSSQLAAAVPARWHLNICMLRDNIRAVDKEYETVSF